MVRKGINMGYTGNSMSDLNGFDFYTRIRNFLAAYDERDACDNFVIGF